MSREARSRVMRAVKSRWTRQEVEFQRLTADHLPERGGREEANADFIFRCAKVAVFLDGDFWHGRNLPASLPASWRAKLERNRDRDARNRVALEAGGWEVISIWESDFWKDPRGWAEDVLDRVECREEEVRLGLA